MSGWREKEWKLPRKGEVVKDPDGNLGWVLRSEGTLTKRILWIENVKGTRRGAGAAKAQGSFSVKKKQLVV